MATRWMRVVLPHRLARFVDDMVESSRHASASEVVGEALRRFEEHVRPQAAMVDALKRLAAERNEEDALPWPEDMHPFFLRWRLPGPGRRMTFAEFLLAAPDDPCFRLWAAQWARVPPPVSRDDEERLARRLARELRIPVPPPGRGRWPLHGLRARVRSLTRKQDRRRLEETLWSTVLWAIERPDLRRTRQGHHAHRRFTSWLALPLRPRRPLRATAPFAVRRCAFRDLMESAPDVLGGTPVIRGTRIPVHDVEASVAAGIPMKRILAAYPALDERKVQLAWIWAEANPARGRPRAARELPVGVVVISDRRVPRRGTTRTGGSPRG